MVRIKKKKLYFQSSFYFTLNSTYITFRQYKFKLIFLNSKIYIVIKKFIGDPDKTVLSPHQYQRAHVQKILLGRELLGDGPNPEHVGEFSFNLQSSIFYYIYKNTSLFSLYIFHLRLI